MGRSFPIPNEEAANVARVLVKQVICRFGTHIATISDRERKVDRQLMNEICRLLDIDNIRATPYHLASNGAIKRFMLLLGPPMFLSVTRTRLHFANRQQSMAASGLNDGPLFTPALTVVWWPSYTL